MLMARAVLRTREAGGSAASGVEARDGRATTSAMAAGMRAQFRRTQQRETRTPPAMATSAAAPPATARLHLDPVGPAPAVQGAGEGGPGDTSERRLAPHAVQATRPTKLRLPHAAQVRKAPVHLRSAPGMNMRARTRCGRKRRPAPRAASIHRRFEGQTFPLHVPVWG